MIDCQLSRDRKREGVKDLFVSLSSIYVFIFFLIVAVSLRRLRWSFSVSFSP